MKTTKQQIINDARLFGSAFIGDCSFAFPRDFDDWKRYLVKNGLHKEFRVVSRGDGWHLIHIPDDFIC